MPIDKRLVERLYRQTPAAKWHVEIDVFTEALESSASRAFPDQENPARRPAREIEHFLSSLHLDDLALACACAAGDEGAWDQFVLDQRPHLYRAADALDPGGGARDLADALYGELFGLENRTGRRQSLFRYFHGRSSLATWLRAVLAQRYVDRLRAGRRTRNLPDDESPAAIVAPERPIDPDRDRYLALLSQGLQRAVADLSARDRLRLACYYAQDMTLAETGRVLDEHEATVSRQLARTRKLIRHAVERGLREDAGLSAEEMAQCFASATADAGPLDLNQLLEVGAGRKEFPPDRS